MRWPAGSVRRITLGRLTTRPALRARQLLADPVATALGLLSVPLFLALMLGLAVLYLLPTPDLRA